MTSQKNRFETNQKIRSVLVRHAVDLTRLEYSCSSSTVYLYGVLIKEPDGEFSPSNIEGLVNELLHLPYIRHVQFDLDNWNISSEFGSWSITKKRQPTEALPERERIVVIEKKEQIEDVLKDLKSDESKEPTDKETDVQTPKD